jgi:GNAT superfamily N-acetyltransferase
MRPEDVAPLVDVCADALWGPIDEALRPRQHERIAHLLATDPGGAWVAEHEGTPAGAAMALVRDGLWGLSLFALAEEHRGTGAGRTLLDAAAAHGKGTRGGIVLSSAHPAAMRLYARLGLDLRPCVSLAGAVRIRPAVPLGVREVSERDHPWMERVSREVRGAAYGPDLARFEAGGAELRCVAERGWIAVRGGEVNVLLARDEEAATALLTWQLAVAREDVEVTFLTAGQDWAIGVGLEAGLALTPDGPVFTRGELGTLRCWIPSGAYL